MTFLESLKAAREKSTPGAGLDNIGNYALLRLLVNNAEKIERLVDAASKIERLVDVQWEPLTPGDVYDLKAALDALNGTADADGEA